MSKTPLTELKEYVHTLEPDTHGCMAMYNAIMRKISALLPTERDVIKEAFEEGINPNSMIRNASDYFTTKFNDNGISKEA
jgi:hypothetical protein